MAWCWPEWRDCVLLAAAEDRVSTENSVVFFLMLWTPAMNQAVRDRREGNRRSVLWLLPSPRASRLLKPEILISSMPCNIFSCFLCSFHLRKVFQSVPPEGAGFLPRQFCLSDFAISSTDTNQLSKQARLRHSLTLSWESTIKSLGSRAKRPLRMYDC